MILVDLARTLKMDMPWVIERDRKLFYLDFETDSLMEARPIIKVYNRDRLEYVVRKNCFGIYGVYCEKHLFSTTIWKYE